MGQNQGWGGGGAVDFVVEADVVAGEEGHVGRLRGGVDWWYDDVFHV